MNEEKPEALEDTGPQVRCDGLLSAARALIDSWEVEANYLNNSDGHYDMGVRRGYLTCRKELMKVLEGA